MKVSRIIIAAVIFSGFWGVTAWAAGGDEPAEPNPIPTEFSIPANLPGDRVTYDVFHVAEETTGPFAGLHFEWLPKQGIHDGMGKAHVADVLEVSIGDWIPDYEADEQRWELDLSITHYLVGDQILALSAHLPVDFNWNGSDVLVGLVETSNNYDGDFGFMSFFKEPVLDSMRPCPAVGLLAGTTFDPTISHQLFAGCLIHGAPRPAQTKGDSTPTLAMDDQPIHPPGRDLSRLEFTAVSTKIIDGAREIVFSSGDAKATLVWYRNDTAYPTQIALPRENGYDVFVLAAHDTVIATSSIPPISDAPPLVWRPTADFGLNETGLEMLFPPSAALEAAKSNEDVAEFFAAYPNARLTNLDGQTSKTWGFQEQQIWTFQFAWGDESIRFETSRDTDSVSQAYSAATALAGYPTTSTTISTGFSSYDEDLLALPLTNSPTAATALAAYEAFSGMPGSSWQLDLTCFEESKYKCRTAGYNVFTGATATSQADPSVSTDGAQFSGSIVSESLAIRTPNHPYSHYIFWNLDGTTAYGTTSKAMDPTEPPTMAATVPSGWTAPSTPVLVGTGAIAALLAALYLFAPTLKTGALGLFSRIQSHQALDNPMRRQVYDTIQAQPGIHFQEVTRTVGAGKGSVEHHLRKLVTTGQVVRHDSAGYACYFPKKTDRRDLAAAPALRSDTARRVLAAIANQPGASGGAIADAVGINRGTLSHHVKRLTAAGVLEARAQGRGIHYWATEVGMRMNRRNA